MSEHSPLLYSSILMRNTRLWSKFRHFTLYFRSAAAGSRAKNLAFGGSMWRALGAVRLEPSEEGGFGHAP